MSNLSQIGRWQQFMATYKGERKKFVKVEHANIGEGCWWCGMVGGGGGTWDSELTDIEPIEGEFAQIDYLRSLSARKSTVRYGFPRREDYTGPIMRIAIDGVERDIFHESELPAGGALGVKLYNQVSGSDGEPSYPFKRFLNGGN